MKANQDAPDEVHKKPRKMLTLTQVLRLVPLSRSTLFRMERVGRFPAGMLLRGKRKFWFQDEVIDWQSDCGSKLRRKTRAAR